MPPTASNNLRASIEKARTSLAFRHYEDVRDLVLRMMDEAAAYEPSAYWQQGVENFDYMFDAGPLVIAKLREHEYHLIGLRSYEYRQHHADYARRFASKLRRLREVDASNLFVPESAVLGGFATASTASW